MAFHAMKSFCLHSLSFRGVKIITQVEECKFLVIENCTWEVGKKLKGSQGQNPSRVAASST